MEGTAEKTTAEPSPVHAGQSSTIDSDRLSYLLERTVSDLTYGEKRKLEQLFEMGGGYVLNFSDRTFQEFVFDTIRKDIYDKKYFYASGSKANRLRGFWKVETNHVVGKLIAELISHCKDTSYQPPDPKLVEECIRIADRLKQGAPVDEMDAISPNSAERDFEVLARSVKEAIEKNEPEAGLDRLHTFTTRYVRVLCEKHGLVIDKDKPLHSLMGEYVKCIRNKGLIESEMTERILKSSISILDAFNDVRNNRSFAHDNSVLNYDEALLIFGHIAGAIRFLSALEKRFDEKTRAAGMDVEEISDIPF